MDKIKVMVIDDSLSIRLLLKGIISKDPQMEVVGTAADPIQAMHELKHTFPDVITLDVEMPQMDGLTFLEKLMRLRPTPVVMISTLTQKNSETALKSLELGAVDIIAKPSQRGEDLRIYSEEILEKIKAAACARVGGHKPRSTLLTSTVSAPVSLPTSLTGSPIFSADAILQATKQAAAGRPKLIAIGASTGGPEALRLLLSNFTSPPPAPVLIAQHISEGFTASLARRLGQQTGLNVAEVTDKAALVPGSIYLCPANKHFGVKYTGSGYMAQLLDGERVNRHKPSVDVLFRSVANEAGGSVLAAILTGMGDDGARGLKEIYDQGGYTIAQDEASCVVFGMPKAAIRLNGVHETLPLSKIAKTITERAKK